MLQETELCSLNLLLRDHHQNAYVFDKEVVDL